MIDTNNPFTDRDLQTRLLFPVVSWSSLNAFVSYSKEDWYDSYVLGIRKSPNAVMQGGIDVGERITQDPTFLPEIPRPEIFEMEFFGALSEGKNSIQLTGHLDGYSPSIPGIDEYKTTCSKTRWNKKAVDTWGQITFYCLLVWINTKVRPEDLLLRLFSIPMKETGDFKIVQEGIPKMFYTKRTMSDILSFAAYIKRTFKEMEEYVEERKKLSTDSLLQIE